VLTGVFHLSFTVDDLERSKDFYGRVLGLELVTEARHDQPYTSRQIGFEGADLKMVQFRIAGVEPQSSTHVLELIEYVHPKGVRIDSATNNTGTAHLAFVVDDIHAEFARLSDAGVRFRSDGPVAIEAGPNRGGWTCYFLDPDGITLELIQRPPG
jgi:catechol 2,3-dioxygenase-like lactoylglutathione lyase family enzyme